MKQSDTYTAKELKVQTGVVLVRVAEGEVLDTSAIRATTDRRAFAAPRQAGVLDVVFLR